MLQHRGLMGIPCVKIRMAMEGERELGALSSLEGCQSKDIMSKGV